MKPSEILKKGLELLGPNGEHWLQGSYEGLQDEKLGYCSLGAIRKVALGRTHDICSGSYGNNKDYDGARESLAKAVDDNDINYMSIATWQDLPIRIFPEVKAKFLEAIALAEAEENKAA